MRLAVGIPVVLSDVKALRRDEPSSMMYTNFCVSGDEVNVASLLKVHSATIRLPSLVVAGKNSFISSTRDKGNNIYIYMYIYIYIIYIYIYNHAENIIIKREKY